MGLLYNSVYTITDFTFFGSAVTPIQFKLHDGTYEMSPSARGALTNQIIAVNAGKAPPPKVLTPSDASLGALIIGDIDGDKVADAVVVVSFDILTGPSQYEVIPIFDRAGQPKQGLSTYLGIRKEVKSIAIRNGDVVINMLDLNQGKNEVATFRLAGDRLEEVTSPPGTPLAKGSAG